MGNPVMVIDPSLVSGKILEVCLRRAGLPSTCFTNWKEALHTLAAFPPRGTGYSIELKGGAEKERLIPAVIVLEIDLQGISGLKVVRLLRSDSAFDETRIVVFSGHDTFVKRLQAKWAGADHFLPKPFDRLLFLSVVSKYITAERTSQGNAPAHDHPGGWNHEQAGKPLSGTGSPRLQSAEDLYAYASRR